MIVLMVEKYSHSGYHWKMKDTVVTISRKAKKSLKKVPSYITLKLVSWIDELSTNGMTETRKIPGYHDEPLRGHWKGYRSIRLSKAYRAIYRMEEDHKLVFVEIVEVNKHDYS